MKHRGMGLCVGITLTCFAAMTMSTPSSAATNLLANPGFEAGGGSYSGWFTFGSGVQLSTPGTDNIIFTGAAASKIYGGFSGGFNVGGFGQAFASPVAGSTYELSGYAYVNSADALTGTDVCANNRLLAKIVFFDATAGGSELQSNEVVVASGNSVQNSWYPFTVSAPAPAGALRVEALFLFLQPAPNQTGAAFVDDASFTVNDTPLQPNVLANPSFTSGLTGWTTFENVFTESRVRAVRTRTGSAKLFTSGTPSLPSGMYQRFAASPGTSWEMGAYVLDACIDFDVINEFNDNLLIGTITFRDGLNNDIGTSQAIWGDNTSPVGTWTRHSVSATAPAGTVAIEAYILFISPSLTGGAFYVDDAWLQQPGITDVAATIRPSGLELRSVAPNPFLNSTRVDYALAESGPVDIGVYDITGRRVATLFHGHADAGPHVATWNGATTDGRRAAAGIYRCVLQSAAGSQARSMILTH